jgi:hypothetical protein
VGLLLLGHVLIFGRTAVGEHLRPLSDYWFAAVWFGYIFVVDAIVYARDGKSLMTRFTKVFLAMLPLSAAGWWGFEWVNGFVQNWVYERPYDIPEWWAQVWSAVFFSTVIPAMWESADLVGGLRVLRRLPRLRQFTVSQPVLLGLIALGVLCFVLPAVWPLYFFPLIWGFVALILDPINYWRGFPSILGYWSRGDWRVPLALYGGGHLCGILWEFWNFQAFPKWHYQVPFVGFWHVFEMPLLGYLGYGPFAWEIFALFWFAASLVRGAKRSRTLRELEASVVEAPQEPLAE